MNDVSVSCYSVGFAYVLCIDCPLGLAVWDYTNCRKGMHNLDDMSI